MDSDYIREPANGFIRYGPEVVNDIRKEFNIVNKSEREEAIDIVDKWIKSQDHFLKKDFSKGYIERCIVTSNGSLERAKKQITKICAMKALMPQYFETTNLKESDIMALFDKTHFAVMPKLTKEYYRIGIIKIKPNAKLAASDYTLFYKLLALVAEYAKSNDYCRGFVLVCDIYDISVLDVISTVNLIEFQQFLPVLTEGYGCKIKGIHIVTASKYIENLINLVKPLFSDKIKSRIHAVTTRESLQNFIDGDVLTVEYGGTEKSIEELNENLVEMMSAKPVQEFLKEMGKTISDVSKIQTNGENLANGHCMGMPGTFRTLTLD